MLSDSTILITGGTGSLGHALVNAIWSNYRPRKIIIFSRDEYKQQIMEREFASIPALRFLLGDVRDAERVREVMDSVDFVFHAAALKQIPRCEYVPIEAIATNVQGSVNVVRACLQTKVQRAILISTDKAVNPVNLYGATKLCAEKLFLAANSFNRTRFKVVRYGNVLGSRGSVIEKFLRLQQLGVKEFPITDERMTRFWITLPQAALLVISALTHEPRIAIPRLRSMKIVDVARAIEPECEFSIIGMCAGEKLHECLVSPDEHVPGFEEGYYSHTNDLWLEPEDLRKALRL